MQANRATFLAASAAFFATPIGLAAQSLTKLRMAGSPDEAGVVVLSGIRNGVFQKYGLDIEIQRTSSGGVALAAVAGGALDIGQGNVFNVISAHARGGPFLLEAPSTVYESTNPTGALLVAKNAPFQTGRDLNGKIVAVPSLGDSFEIVNSAWIDQNGGDSRTVKFLELPAPSETEAVATGRVDAATVAEPYFYESIRSGKCRVLGYSQDAIAKSYLSTAYFCSIDFATKNADVVARFRKALAETVTSSNAHRAELIPLIASYTGVDASIVAAMPASKHAVTFDPALIQPLIDAAYKYKAIPAPFPATDIIDPAALRAP